MRQYRCATSYDEPYFAELQKGDPRYDESYWMGSGHQVPTPVMDVFLLAMLGNGDHLL
jgi:hypothetical protein